MHEKILEELIIIEKEEGVRILYAVESGSRAWGFASSDSDFDVRFIYIHPPEWYLSIANRKDVIEYPTDDLLDISGWDIQKALKLFRKSNPPLLEWLCSPVVYLERYDFAQKLRELTDCYFSPKVCIYHYLHMAQGNYREYLRGRFVRAKKYFYVLRPVLACRWIEDNNTMPPVEFEKLLNSQVRDNELRDEIQRLLERKRTGEELDYEPKIKIINDFLNDEIQYYTQYAKKIDQHAQPDIAILDKLFRDTLENVW